MATTYRFNFSIWAADPDNESLLNIFRYVCSILNPLINDICQIFGYQGYLRAVNSLIIFFGEEEEAEKIDELIRVFPMLHDAGLAACCKPNPASKRFLETLYELETYLEITPELCSEIFDI